MRRASFTGVSAGGGPGGEPLIVVEESGGIAEEDEEENCSKESSPGDAAAINQYLLTPYRDLRKRSLPTPPCTSGITASQVRRLSERGGEGSGPSAMEQAFLATLSQSPAPQPGARRHSVVTICRAPPPCTLFGRNRRESIAAFTPGLLRRDSRGSLSGQGSNPGSSLNLQLDIMDDIRDAKARAKEKRKTSWAPITKELEETPCTSKGKRRASDLPSLHLKSGIVCTNDDLINLMSPMTSSAGEVGAAVEKDQPNIIVNPNTGSPTTKSNDRKKKLLIDRSNSLDINPTVGTSNWFQKRHQPHTINISSEKPKHTVVTLTDDKPKTRLADCESQQQEQQQQQQQQQQQLLQQQQSAAEPGRVVWDQNAVVDPNVIGSAIEVFLNRRSSSSKDQEADAKNSESTSLCSSLKDLFVK